MTINLDLNKLGPIQKKRWRIAYHEIGHVIAYIHYNYPFDYVTIVSNGKLAGHVKSPDLFDENNLTVEQLEICSAILLAGEALDRRLFGSHTRHECGGRHDFGELYRLHVQNNKKGFTRQREFYRTNYFLSVSRKVAGILRQYEKAIHVLAHELRKKKTLTSDDVFTMLGRVEQAHVDVKSVWPKKRKRSMFEMSGLNDIPDIETLVRERVDSSEVSDQVEDREYCFMQYLSSLSRSFLREIERFQFSKITFIDAVSVSSNR